MEKKMRFSEQLWCSWSQVFEITFIYRSSLQISVSGIASGQVRNFFLASVFTCNNHGPGLQPTASASLPHSTRGSAVTQSLETKAGLESGPKYPAWSTATPTLWTSNDSYKILSLFICPQYITYMLLDICFV